MICCHKWEYFTNFHFTKILCSVIVREGNRSPGCTVHTACDKFLDVLRSNAEYCTRRPCTLHMSGSPNQFWKKCWIIGWIFSWQIDVMKPIFTSKTVFFSLTIWRVKISTSEGCDRWSVWHFCAFDDGAEWKALSRDVYKRLLKNDWSPMKGGQEVGLQQCVNLLASNAVQLWNNRMHHIW